jgi:hypothetical protein
VGYSWHLLLKTFSAVAHVVFVGIVVVAVEAVDVAVVVYVVALLLLAVELHS